ncbi:hypothetical protein [Mesonia mobilis]|uniref:hypothetical protein n=1 Tax=Mesonia mobilis TaxID=369791 RepID=UPI0026EA403B|nr:hypothetical protein [Mesonia mobilis]
MKNFKISPEINALYTRLKLKSDGYVDLISAAAAIGSIVYSDYIDLDNITPQMEEAFKLSFPNKELSDLGDMTSEQLEGVVNNWKGKYFEVLLRDELNAGEQIGSLVLEDGQLVKLSENLNEPGWDLQILNADGTIAQEIQAKASENISYVKEALERYDYDVITTSEISNFSERINTSNFADSTLETEISSPIEALFDSNAMNIIEEVAPALPFIIITVSEGRKVMVGKQTLQAGFQKSTSRGLKTGASMSAAYIAGVLFGGAIAVPVGIATKLSIDRFRNNSSIAEEMEETNRKLGQLEKKYLF